MILTFDRLTLLKPTAVLCYWYIHKLSSVHEYFNAPAMHMIRNFVIAIFDFLIMQLQGMTQFVAQHFQKMWRLCSLTIMHIRPKLYGACDHDPSGTARVGCNRRLPRAQVSGGTKRRGQQSALQFSAQINQIITFSLNFPVLPLTSQLCSSE